MRKMAFTVGVALLVCGATLPAVAAQPTAVSLATATPGGGFPVFGDAAAAVINATDPTLAVTTHNTKGSTENIMLLEQGKMDTALVAGEPAYEAFSGIGRAPTRLLIISAIYSSPGLFAVKADSPARSARDLLGQRIAWGTRASGLTLLGRYVMDGLGLDRDKDFVPIYLDKAGDGPGMVASGAVAALWGGGRGWPGFKAVAAAGGRFIGFTPEEISRITTKHPFLKPAVVAAGTYQGQAEAIHSVSSWSYLLARSDLPDDTAYRLAKALHAGQAELVRRTVQARETTPENTRLGAPGENQIHPGVRRYLAELGL